MTQTLFQQLKLELRGVTSYTVNTDGETDPTSNKSGNECERVTKVDHGKRLQQKWQTKVTSKSKNNQNKWPYLIICLCKHEVVLYMFKVSCLKRTQTGKLTK